MSRERVRSLMERLALNTAAELAYLRESDPQFRGKQTFPDWHALMSSSRHRKVLVQALERWISYAVGFGVSVRSHEALAELMRLKTSGSRDLVPKSELIHGAFFDRGATLGPGSGTPPDFIYENIAPYLLFGTLTNYHRMLAAFLERYFRDPGPSQSLGRIQFARWARPSLKSWAAYTLMVDSKKGRRFSPRLPTIGREDWREAYKRLFKKRLTTHDSSSSLFRLARDGRQLHSTQERLHLVSMWVPGVGLPPLADYEEPDRWPDSIVWRKTRDGNWFEHWQIWSEQRPLPQDLFIHEPLSARHFEFIRLLNLHGFKLGLVGGPQSSRTVNQPPV